MKTIDFSSKDFQINPWPAYRHLRTFDPIHWSSPNRCFFLLKQRHVRQALESDSFSVMHPLRASRQVFGTTMLNLDGSPHKKSRTSVSFKFRVNNVNSYVDKIVQPIVHELIDELLAQNQADFMSDFAVHLPTRVMTQVMGIPMEDALMLYQQLHPITQYLDNQDASLEEAILAKNKLSSYFWAMIKSHQSISSDTVIGQLLETHRANREFSIMESLSTILLLFFAGTETTTSAIGNTLVSLLKHPDILKTAQENPDFIPSVIREVLRWEPPLHTISRFVKEDIKIDKIILRRGTHVQLSLASANRDEECYNHPDDFVPNRPEKSILSFGAGQHSCLGFFLAKQELEIVLRLLLERLTEIRTVAKTVPAIQGRIFRRPDSLILSFQKR